MFFKQLKIESFRNFDSLSFFPGEHINLVFGNNGSGKSSLLEAIAYLSLGKSFRTNHLQSLINNKSDHFVIFADKDNAKIGIKRNNLSDIDIRINGVSTNKLSDLAFLTPMQVIHPADLDLVLGGPSIRRAFIDWGAFYHIPDFFLSWSNFKRILKQRNSYLKNSNNYKLIRILDKELVNQANRLNYFRTTYFENIKLFILKILKSFLPEYEFDLIFYPGWDVRKNLELILNESFERDLFYGYTVNGPQRADLRILVNGLSSQEVLSRGQIKLLLCALKIAQGCYLEDRCNNNCTFLFDDFSSELDTEKKSMLSSFFKSMKGQVFITAIDSDDKNFFQGSNYKIFELQNNMIEQR